jgi:hypothetical protein
MNKYAYPMDKQLKEKVKRKVKLILAAARYCPKNWWAEKYFYKKNVAFVLSGV